jgi:hypothetical protein
MSWNRTEMRAYIVEINPEWRKIMVDAFNRPLIYIPLQHHFEEEFHVAHRLDRYGAGSFDIVPNGGPAGLRPIRGPRSAGG